MNFLDIIFAIIYGVVEGITEWLPVSSTGHLILLERLFKMNVSDDFMDMFRVVIQLGAIMAVVVIYWKQIWFMDFHAFKEKPTFKKDILNLWGKILVACVPAAVIGLLFDDFFDALFYWEVPIAIALIVFGIAFIVIETLNKKKTARVEGVADITYKLALIIGVFQLIAAIFPGTSRSGATIVGALLIGVSRAAAADFTFFLAIPVMFGASLLKIAKYVLYNKYVCGNCGFIYETRELSQDYVCEMCQNNAAIFERMPKTNMQEIIILIVGMVVAYGVSMIVIKFLLKFIKKHDFKVFGWYRIVLGILVLAMFFLV